MLRLCGIPVGGIRYAEYLALDASERPYWIGEGAARLGLSGPVEDRQFYLLERGMHPETEERLRSRISQGQTHNGKHYALGRSSYDIVVHAPKSMAVLALLDDRLQAAHKESVQEIKKQIEDHACVRVRKGEAHNTDGMRPSRNIVAGLWLHAHSRALDPLIHSHIAALNLSYDPVEQKWKALQAVEIYRHRWELSELYRQNLAQRLDAFGYDLRPHELDKTRYPKEYLFERKWGFQIAGISPEILAKMSTRTQQRDTAIAEYLRANPGAELSERIVSKLVRENREPKQAYTLVQREEIRERQLARLTPAERAQLRHVHEQALEQSQKRKHRLDEGGDYGPGMRNVRWTYGEENGYGMKA